MQDSIVSRTVSWTNLVNLLCLSVLSLANGSCTSEGSPGKQNQYFTHTHTHTLLTHTHTHTHPSQVVLLVKNPPANAGERWEMQVPSLGQKDTLQEEVATHSSILAWRTPWTKEPGRLQSIGSQRVGHDWSDSLHMSISVEMICEIDSLIHTFTQFGGRKVLWKLKM